MTGFEQIKAAADAATNYKELDTQALATAIMKAVSDHIHGPEATVAQHVVPLEQVNSAYAMAIGSSYSNGFANLTMAQRCHVSEDLLEKIEIVLTQITLRGDQ